uniref:IS110 family transposase n=1 Tax=Ruegeria haliotis TaxID=2747601 RepID=UPI0038B62848
MEACGSSHHWGRQLRKLWHDVKLMPAGYFKPYVKRGKSDAVDAEAICEAVRRPTMRFVEIKTEKQQAILSIHRTRDLAVRQRTQLANMIRSLLREFGYILPIGIEAVTAFAKRHLDGDQPEMPEIANGMLGIQCYQFIGLNARIYGYSKMIEQHVLLNADARRLTRMHSPLCLNQWRTNGSSSGRSRRQRLSQRSVMQNSSGPGAIWRPGSD